MVERNYQMIFIELSDAWASPLRGSAQGGPAGPVFQFIHLDWEHICTDQVDPHFSGILVHPPQIGVILSGPGLLLPRKGPA